MGRAFTFVEVTLVIAIIAIIGAIAVPRYAGAIARYRALAAASRITADIALTQAAARAASTSRSIVFNYGSPSTYSIANVTDIRTGASTYTVRLAEEPYSTRIASAVSTNAAAAMSSSATKLTFDGFGTPDGTFTLVVASGNSTRTITVDPSTGRCSVQ